jgi:hypothetical protein
LFGNDVIGDLVAFTEVIQASLLNRRARADHDALGHAAPPRAGGSPVTNIRNTTSPHWRGWLKPESRCLVPANSFAEYASEPNPATGRKDVVWFALNDDRPLFAFGGIWTEFRGVRPGFAGCHVPVDPGHRRARQRGLSAAGFIDSSGIWRISIEWSKLGSHLATAS